jgi:hypothetical protein
LPEGAVVQVRKKLLKKKHRDGSRQLEEVEERVAVWNDRAGKLRSAPVTLGKGGAVRIRDESSTYFARYRNGQGLVVEVSTRCRDRTAAQSILTDLERQAERVRGKLLTAAEARISEHLGTPINEHVDAYLTSLQASGASPKHVVESRRVLNAVLRGCGFATLADLERPAVERWLAKRRQDGASVRTRNIDLARLIAFANWCKEADRLLSNPFDAISKGNEEETKRRRRSMTEVELSNLLNVARYRPLLALVAWERISFGPKLGW